MRVTHIGATDCLGGAARAAFRLHEGLQAAGVESGMFVGTKASHNSAVIPFVPATSLMARLSRIVRRAARVYAAQGNTAPAGRMRWIFSDDRSTHGGEAWDQCPDADILHLHWVAGFVDRRFFRWLPENARLVWTLHDMNPFTGGCHFDAECGRFTEECGSCPQLCAHRQNDLSHAIWQRKKTNLARLHVEQLRVVTPSRWLGEKACQSTLLGRFPRHVIPNGLDTEVFRPRDPRLMREVLGIPLSARVILFVAQGVDDTRKGFSLLVRAMEGIAPSADVYMLSVGSGAPIKIPSIRHVHLQTIQDDRVLASLYSAADVFVAPSLQDNLPNTVLESMACGTPVVAFNTGGIPDAVRPGETGLLRPVGDADGLRDAVLGLIENDEMRAEMSHHCRKVALEEYDLGIQARRYMNLYEEIVAKARPATAN